MRYDLPVVETKRLLLRPIEEGDVCDMFEYLSDVDVTRYLTFQPHKDINYTLQMLRKITLPYMSQQDGETWAIVWKETDKMIGDLHFHTICDERAQMGYSLHKSYWSKGIMQEALDELIRIGFMYTGLYRMEALYEAHHDASARVLQKCGFRIEGVLRKYMKLADDTYHDMCICALLKEEWEEIEYEKRITTKI